MSDKEARQLLGLPKTGTLDKARIETGFNRLAREHQARLNSALTKEDREKETKILILLQQAKTICLGIKSGEQHAAIPVNTSSQGGYTTSASHPGTPYQRRRYHGNGSVRNTVVKFSDIFVHLWLSLKSLFEFVVSIPAAFIEIKDFIANWLDFMQAAGIPKIVVVLALILGLIPLIPGCVQFAHKIALWFK